MISGAEIRAARERAGLTQQELGMAVGVGLRTVGNWERGETVPRNREARLRAVLADHMTDHHAPPLRAVSDAEVVAEVARRMSVAREGSEHHEHRAAATTQAGGSPAVELDQIRDRLLARFRDYVREADEARRDAKDAGPWLAQLRADFEAAVVSEFARVRPEIAEDVG